MGGKPPAFRLKTKAEPEHDLQRRLNRILILEIGRAGHVSRYGVCWFAVDHAAHSAEVRTRVDRGVIAGIPDVWFFWDGRAGCIELKNEHGELTEPQREVLPALALSGVQCAVACDPWQVLRVLDHWGVPRFHRVREAA